MTAVSHLSMLLLVMDFAFLASGYQAPLRRMATFRSTITHFRLNQLEQQQADGIVAMPPRSSTSVRPVPLTVSATTAAAIFASISIMPSHAADSLDMSRVNYLDSETFSIILPESMKGAAWSSPYYPTTTIAFTSSLSSSSTLQLSSSTMANPIGELKDGSENSVEVSAGQWFFVIYIVVSLLAGGKEIIRRIQKQMDNDA